MDKDKVDCFTKSLIYKNIQFYNEMILLSKNSYQRNYYEDLLNKERMWLNCWENKYYNNIESVKSTETTETVQRSFTIEELSQFNGSGGSPAYVAVNGIVYDVSLAPGWGGGTHFALYSGQDLSDQFNACHEGIIGILRNLPIVGVLITRSE